MKGKQTKGAFSISLLALASFLLVIYKASAYELSLPFETPGLHQLGQQCGKRGGYKMCPPKHCCSYWGWCGTTEDYCIPGRCENQCPGPCGKGNPDILACPPGFCCSKSGMCGNTKDYCDRANCQSQCNRPAPPIPKGRCGFQAGGVLCPLGQCCNKQGWCGTGSKYCAFWNCQYQCVDSFIVKNNITLPDKNRMRGIASFLFNAV